MGSAHTNNCIMDICPHSKRYYFQNILCLGPVQLCSAAHVWNHLLTIYSVFLTVYCVHMCMHVCMYDTVCVRAAQVPWTLVAADISCNGM